MPLLAALLSGLLFGLGLTVSGMINPAKVLGFLDVAGHWDPSLAFVMATAIPVAAVGFAIARRCTTPLCVATFSYPLKTKVDVRLVIGAITFGVGWGLGGFCPGPALASIGFGSRQPLLFVIAMVAGMAACQLLDGFASRKPKAA